jgi:hypothetical protein
MSAASRTSATPVSVPWPLAELIRVYAVNAAALIALLAAWWAAAGTVRNTSQVTAVAVAVTAVVVGGSGNAVWLMVGRRAVGIRRAEVRARLEALVEVLQDELPAAYPEPTAAARSLVTLPNATRYHRPDCRLVTGKSAVVWSADDGRSTPRARCGVCLP